MKYFLCNSEIISNGIFIFLINFLRDEYIKFKLIVAEHYIKNNFCIMIQPYFLSISLVSVSLMQNENHNTKYSAKNKSKIQKKRSPPKSHTNFLELPLPSYSISLKHISYRIQPLCAVILDSIQLILFRFS